MRIEEADVILDETELAGLAALLRPLSGRLALIAPATLEGDHQASLSAEVRALPSEARSQLQWLVNTLAFPVRIANLHFSVADERVSRQVMAWAASPAEGPAFLARNGDLWRAGTRSDFQVKTLIREVLAAGDMLRRESLSLAISTPAVLTLLGVLDHLRYARLYSQLLHQEPVESFAPAEVLTRIQAAKTEDFRWPLLLVEKLMPVDFTTAFTESEVVDGLAELTEAELVEPLDDSGRALLYALTAEGRVIADAVLHDVSKLALSLSECGPDGQVGHDVMLFIRGGMSLFLFM